MARDLSRVLSHLNEEDVAALMRRYYAGESVAVLLRDYDVKVNAGNLSRCFPPEVLTAPCVVCGGVVVRPRSSRSGRQVAAACEQCGHDGTNRCHCEVCQEQRRQLQEAADARNRLAVVESYNARRARAVSFWDLTVEERVHLGALLAGHPGQSKTIISPLSTFPLPLLARWDPVDTILMSLLSADRIAIYPTRDLSPFVFPEGENWRFYPAKVHYELNVVEPEASAWLVHPDPPALDEADEIRDIWRMTAAEEVREYLDVLMRERGIQLDFGDKTLDAIDHMVAHFPVSQAYYFCYLTAKNTSDDIQSRKKTKRHAANTVPFRLNGYVDKAIGGQWDVSHYSRDKRCPQTALASFFFDSVVKVGHRGFNLRPEDWQPPSPLDETEPPPNVVPFPG